MNTKQIFLISVLSLMCIVTLKAQNPVATLEHNGITQVFYGQNSLVESYNASAAGDTINLSAGYFNTPASIAKGIKIIGAGHFPDSATVTRRSTLLSNLTIVQGADNFKIEGVFINGAINFSNEPVSSVSIVRCNCLWVNMSSDGASNSKDNCSIEECFISMDGNSASVLSIFGNTNLIRHNILRGSISNASGSCVIDGNVFLCEGCSSFSTVTASQITNNVILGTPYVMNNCTSNSFYNNLFVQGYVDFGNNSSSNNYFGVPQANIFINQNGNVASYTDDYHLQHPELYIGTDGTQVGLYGGIVPFKDKGYPSNPAILSKSVAPQTDANGNLLISFTVKAQDN